MSIRFRFVVGAIAAGLAVLGMPSTAFRDGADAQGADLQKIQHIVVIMQENRSFDHYFGTYPGAEGLPTKDGKFTICIPDPAKGSCAEPFRDTNDRNFGAGHGAAAATADIDGGKMDGFVKQAELEKDKACRDPNDPSCAFKDARLD